ncbi:sensor histidine kinase [Frankia canadensis]|nr:sensor histidine kinase [Frankia canadensis]
MAVDTAVRRVGQLSSRVRGVIRLRDVAALLATGLVVVGASHGAAHDQVPPARPLDALAFTLLALLAATVTLRRRSPLAMLAASALLLGTLLGAGYPHGPSFLPVVVASVSVGLRHELRVVWRAAAGATAVVLAGSALGAAQGYAPGRWEMAFQAVGAVLLCTVPALVGALARGSRAAAAQVKEEATRRRVEQERLRMAREVHDVVGHSLSVISLRAAVALHVLDRRPEQAQLALEAIRRASVDALGELRSTLALTRAGQDAGPAGDGPGADGTGGDGPGGGELGVRGTEIGGSAAAAGYPGAGRVPDGDPVEAPLTGLGRLPSLLREVRLCDVPVQLVTDGDSARLGELPVDVDLAAFRIIQESLTNVLRHAPRASTQVRVRLALAADRLCVDITDSPDPLLPAEPTAGSAQPAEVVGVVGVGEVTTSAGAGGCGGHGLTGLRERAAELGGTLTAGPVAGGWRVFAELPVPAAAVPVEARR